MVASLHNLPAARVAREEQVRWKTGSKEGWSKNKDSSKGASSKINEVVHNNENNIDEVLQKVEAIET